MPRISSNSLREAGCAARASITRLKNPRIFKNLAYALPYLVPQGVSPSWGPPVILADMGAGAGQVTYDWFDRMYPSVAEAGIAFTSVGVITADPASVESVLAWASRLRD